MSANPVAEIAGGETLRTIRKRLDPTTQPARDEEDHDHRGAQSDHKGQQHGPSQACKTLLHQRQGQGDANDVHPIGVGNPLGVVQEFRSQRVAVSRGGGIAIAERRDDFRSLAVVVHACGILAGIPHHRTFAVNYRDAQAFGVVVQLVDPLLDRGGIEFGFLQHGDDPRGQSTELIDLLLGEEGRHPAGNKPPRHEDDHALQNDQHQRQLNEHRIRS